MALTATNYRNNHNSPSKRGAVVIQQPRLLNGQAASISQDNHSSLSLRAPQVSCKLWCTCCHHLPRQPLDAVLKSEPTLDITRLDVPAPVTAQLEQTEVLRDWLNADTVVHILIQKNNTISKNYLLAKVSCFRYMSQSSKVNIKGHMYYINFMKFNLRASCL